MNLEDQESIKDLTSQNNHLKPHTQKELREWQKQTKSKIGNLDLKDSIRLVIEKITISNERLEVYSSSVGPAENSCFMVKSVSRDSIMKLSLN
jgi:hypothetical protein